MSAKPTYEELLKRVKELELSDSERRQAEDEMWESEIKLRGILDNIPDLVWLKDSESRFLVVNQAFGLACGHRPEDLTGKTDLDVWPRELAERYRKDDFEVMAVGKRKQVEEPLQEEDGNTLWIETIKTPIRNESGAIIGTAGIARDITKRKKAEGALLASEARYRSYIDATGQIGWVTNADGEVGEDVPSLRKFSGQTYEEAKGSGWTKALHPDDLERTLQGWNKAVSAKSPFEAEYRMRRHDGVYRHLLARGFPVFKEDKSIREWVGTCIDITERKEAEIIKEALLEKLQNALQEIKTLRGIIPICSHCKKIRDDEGLWSQIDAYISKHSEAEFSHGICPDCAKKYYPDFNLFEDE